MPRRNPFQFQTLLRVRRHQQDAKALALAEIQREIRVLQGQRAEIAAQQRRTLEQAAEAARDEFDADDVRRHYQYERYLSHLVDEKDASVAALRRTEDERRKELEDAIKSKRIVERLQERRQEALMYELNKLEQVSSDEAATNSAAVARREKTTS